MSRKRRVQPDKYRCQAKTHQGVRCSNPWDWQANGFRFCWIHTASELMKGATPVWRENRKSPPLTCWIVEEEAS